MGKKTATAPRPLGKVDRDSAEYVCLECPLPECDENSLGCRYRVLRPKQDQYARKRERK
jgi:hypothetical protein